MGICCQAPARAPVSLASRISPRHVTPAQSRGRALRTVRRLAPRSAAASPLLTHRAFWGEQRAALPAVLLQVAEEATKYGAVEAPVEAVVGAQNRFSARLLCVFLPSL